MERERGGAREGEGGEREREEGEGKEFNIEVDCRLWELSKADPPAADTWVPSGNFQRELGRRLSGSRGCCLSVKIQVQIPRTHIKSQMW